MDINKKYEIVYNGVEGFDEYIELTIKDLRDFFISSRGFPSILNIGVLSGEGQSGGRFITDIARTLEAEIVKDIGLEEYKRQMDKLMGRND